MFSGHAVHTPVLLERVAGGALHSFCLHLQLLSCSFRRVVQGARSCKGHKGDVLLPNTPTPFHIGSTQTKAWVHCELSRIMLNSIASFLAEPCWLLSAH